MILKQFTGDDGNCFDCWGFYPEKHPLKLWEKDMPYALPEDPQDPPSLTPFLLDGQLRGAVIVCPGGAYAFKSYAESEPVARRINAMGYHAFVLDYRVAPYHAPAQLADVQRAVRLVRYHAADWAVDPDHIAILGFSAGGHLAAMAANLFDLGDAGAEDPVDRLSSRPNAAILCYPVITMADGVTHEGSRVNLLGEGWTEAMQQQYAMENRVTPQTPPTFMWHTMEDHAVPVENTFRMLAACRKAGITAEAHFFPHGEHGLDLALGDPVVSQWPELMHQFLKSLNF